MEHDRHNFGQALKNQVFRTVRCNPAVELVQNRMRRMSGVSFDEIGLFIPLGREDVVIDGGANVGFITSRCARTGATIHAFEPNPLCHKILRQRFALMPNVHIHNKGLMDRNCTLALSTPVPHNGYDAIETTVAASFVAERFDADVTQEQIECIDIAEFVTSLAKPVALLKLDIEGAEVAAINRLIDTGAIDQIKMAVVETHERFSDDQAKQTKALRKRLSDAGLDERVRLDWI